MPFWEIFVGHDAECQFHLHDNIKATCPIILLMIMLIVLEMSPLVAFSSSIAERHNDNSSPFRREMDHERWQKWSRFARKWVKWVSGRQGKRKEKKKLIGLGPQVTFAKNIILLIMYIEYSNFFRKEFVEFYCLETTSLHNMHL